MKFVLFAAIFVACLCLCAAGGIIKVPGTSRANCTKDADCKGAAWYCRKANCFSRIGQCYSPVALKCPTTTVPVCGCDGQSYDSACKAALNKSNIDYQGPCKKQNPCQANTDCASGQFCRQAQGCTGNGFCDIKPTTCTTEFLPTCGCDGKTYQNKCKAASAGQSVQSSGKCRGGGKVPAPANACKNNTDCSPGSFCLRPTGRCNSPGRCFRPSKSCTGTPKKQPGQPGGKPGQPGGKPGQPGGKPGQPGGKPGQPGGKPNQPGQPGGKPGKPDQPGKDRPGKGKNAGQPVCGCDGKPYDNSCKARAAFVNVKTKGGCDSNRFDDEFFDEEDDEEFGLDEGEFEEAMPDYHELDNEVNENEDDEDDEDEEIDQESVAFPKDIDYNLDFDAEDDEEAFAGVHSDDFEAADEEMPMESNFVSEGFEVEDDE